MSLTDLAQNLIYSKFNRIKYAADATCGNGHDTLFLSRLCDIGGMVYSFDIQEDTIKQTARALAENNLTSKVKLIHSGHENMLEHINNEVVIIMFNLGYLPNSDRKICTYSDTTLIALESSLKILSENGVISIICYPGHRSGLEETKSVKYWVSILNKNKFIVREYLSETPDKTTPVLYIIERRPIYSD